MEAQLQTIWDEKLQRLSGGGASREENLVLFSQVWDAVWPRLQPKDSLDYLSVTDDEDARAFQSLADHDVSKTAYVGAFGRCRAVNKVPSDLEILDAMRRKKDILRNELITYIELWQTSEDIEDFIPLFTRLAEWRTLWLRPFVPPAQTAIPSHLLDGFNSILFYVLPTTFPDALTAVFEMTLDRPQKEYQAMLELIASFGIIRNFETLICRVAYRAIERRIAESCPEKWHESCLRDILEWVQQSLAPWSAHVFSFDPELQKSATYAGDRNIAQRYEFQVYKTLCDLRISELFEIISDVEPDAKVLTDLKECVIRVSGRIDLIRSLRQQIAKRLLHPGAETSDIIEFYISMIRCLRVVDPQGVLLYRVADPIRSYLRGRPDTIHHIVTQLINEKSELAQEAQAPIVPEMEHEDYSDPKWIPDPPDAGPKFRTMRPTDLISTLVSIYDSHELFIKEVQSLFANMLLQSREGAFDDEKRQLEILKLRFGDAALQGPDVMLSDMQASSRTNKQINVSQSEVAMKPAIVSRWFWPPPPEMDNFKMPGQFARMQEDFAKRFQELKPDKKLHWIHQMGSLKLSIELKDRTVDVNATPLEAAVIELFSEKPSWPQEALAEHLGVKEATLIGALISWNEEGVLEFSDYLKTWRLVEEGDASRAASFTTNQSASQSTRGASPKVNDARDQQHWQYIKTMLTNFNGGLSTAAIHNMLKYTAERKTIEELNAMLERIQAEGLIECADGVWRLV